MNNLQKLGLKSDILLKKSYFLSKILTLNTFTIPVCKRIRIIFPLYESESFLRSKSIMILLEFLEQISGLRAIIKKANMIVGSGLWVRGQVDLSGFNLMKFLIFFNEYFLSHPLLRFSSRLPFLRLMSKNSIKLVLSDIDFFFDASTKRLLPHTNHYWLELNFFFDNKFKLDNSTNILFYTQYFFSNHLLEWRNL
jgi:hypothetical protein